VRIIPTWNERTARLFACDCAERALGTIETPDERSVHAIAVARAYALGEATEEELVAAARPIKPVKTAARTAERALAAAAAKEDAADGAAWAAVLTAALADARGAEREWQTKRLFEYLDGSRAAA
jgi:hypothetical protein